MSYVVESNTAALRLGAYDADLPLTIDPVLAYSGQIALPAGGCDPKIAADTAGNLYLVTCGIYSAASPAYGTGAGSVSVLKLDPTGQNIARCCFGWK